MTDDATPVVTQTLSITLTAGYTATTTATWTLPITPTEHTLKAVADPDGQVTETDEGNNEIALETTLPDLLVDLLSTAHSSQALTVMTRLANTGALNTMTPFTVALRAGDPLTGTLLATASVNESVWAGGQVTVTQVLTDPASLAGLGEALWAVADAGDAVAEADETNNTAATPLAVLPDLTLTAEDIQVGSALSVTAHNAGFITATNALVEVRRAATPSPAHC